MTKKFTNILVTGGCGFIGSNFIRLILTQRAGVNILNVDRLTYAGNLANLKDIEEEYKGRRYQFLRGDIADKAFILDLFSRQNIDWVINFAAESHVDRSILGPEDFIRTNIYGTFNLLEAARQRWLLKPNEITKKRFLHISTDEVYGSLSETGLFCESSPYDPSSPYSASKASSDYLVRAYFRTYDLPVLITNCTNNYGPYQFPEKLIPLMINNALKGEKLPLYGDGRYIRGWLHVEDHCRAILLVLEKGEIGEGYNIGGNCEKENRDVVFLICDLLDRRLGLYHDKPRRELIHFVTDRPGHDRRYALDASKIRNKLGWKPEIPFEDGLKSTVEWYIDNQEWVTDILDGSYMEYYQKQYGERLNSDQ